ncbi:synaptic vesicle membrane protein VAT-1 homolog isoform X6 [Panulirus ornatus]|uniref:synaptic vesicle membrane protein VAT-1 homolog isoform X6 n=1 Tax=Panulirus ornatus TaxID=150431 RepID=UPI003A85A984
MVRRIVVKGIGGYEQLKVEDAPPPAPPSANEVIVEVKACGLNFYDIYVRQGLSPDVQPPCTLGLECAGVVTAIGEKVTSVKIGDHVAVHCPRGGGFAEQISVNEDLLLVVPENMSFEVAASFTINYLTAYFSLFHLGGLRANGAVLIHSSAGGVGWAATQLSKTVPGVSVFGTASAHKHNAVVENGVDYPIHYDQVVLIGAREMVGTEYRSLWRLLRSWWSTKNVSPYSLIMSNRAVAGFNLNELRSKDPATFQQGWKEILEMITSGKLCPRIDSVWQFEQIVEASKQITDRKNIGKVIVKP